MVVITSRRRLSLLPESVAKRSVCILRFFARPSLSADSSIHTAIGCLQKLTNYYPQKKIPLVKGSGYGSYINHTLFFRGLIIYRVNFLIFPGQFLWSGGDKSKFIIFYLHIFFSYWNIILFLIFFSIGFYYLYTLLCEWMIFLASYIH